MIIFNDLDYRSDYNVVNTCNCFDTSESIANVALQYKNTHYTITHNP